MRHRLDTVELPLQAIPTFLRGEFQQDPPRMRAPQSLKFALL